MKVSFSLKTSEIEMTETVAAEFNSSISCIRSCPKEFARPLYSGNLPSFSSI